MQRSPSMTAVLVSSSGLVMIEFPAKHAPRVVRPSIDDNLASIGATRAGKLSELESVIAHALLAKLQVWLNRIHGENFSERFWDIVVGKSVRHFAHTAALSYAYVARLESLGIRGDASLRFHGQVPLTCVPAVPINNQAAAYALRQSQFYPFLLFVEALQQKGHVVGDGWTEGPIALWFEDAEQRFGPTRAPDAVANGLFRTFRDDLLAILRPAIAERIDIFGGWTLRDRIALLLASGFRAWNSHVHTRILEAVPPNLAVRQHLSSYLDELPSPASTKTIWGQYFVDRCMRYYAFLLPQTALEQFAYLRDLAGERIEKEGLPAAILSPANVDSIAVWAGMCAEQGTRLMYLQHGGRYGESFPTPLEIYEREVGDWFGTWGWREERHRLSDRDVGATPSVPFQLRKRKRDFIRANRARNRKSDILWVTQEHEWCHEWPPYESGEEYVDRQKLILEVLHRIGDSAITLRLRPPKGSTDPLEGYGWVFETPLQLDVGDRPITQALAGTRLVLIDRPFSTTFVECLAIGKPVITVSPGILEFVRGRAKTVVARLVESRVILDNLDNFERDLTIAVRNPEGWWRSPERVEAVSRAREEFADLGSIRRLAHQLGT